MYVKYHVLLGAIFTFLIWLIWPQVGITGVVLIFLSSFLIDVDHYVFYALGNHDWNLKNASNWFIDIKRRFEKLPKSKRKKYHTGILPFHSIEFLVPVFSLGFLLNFFFFIFIGFAFHIFFDMIYEIFISKIAVNKISLIYTLAKKEFIGF